jgi:hypothetical protein
VIPSSAARKPSNGIRNSGTCWVPAPPSGKAIEFNVILTKPPAIPANGWPGKNSMNTELAGSFELENGEMVWVVYRQIDSPKFKDVSIPVEAFKSSKIEDNANLTIALFGKNDDGSRFVFEAPLDTSEVRQKLRELSEKKQKTHNQED